MWFKCVVSSAKKKGMLSEIFEFTGVHSACLCSTRAITAKSPKVIWNITTSVFFGGGGQNCRKEVPYLSAGKMSTLALHTGCMQGAGRLINPLVSLEGCWWVSVRWILLVYVFGNWSRRVFVLNSNNTKAHIIMTVALPQGSSSTKRLAADPEGRAGGA
jgi:hypothetical protein